MLQNDFHLPTIEVKNIDNIQSITDTASIKLDLNATDTKYALDRINVWINDVAAFGTNGVSVKNANTNKVEKELTISLAKGQNKIEVSSVNQAGAESYKETFTINCTAGKPKPDLYIITIGVSTYSDERFNLKYAAKDAIKKIRDERPGSIQSEVQELAIGFYEKHVRNWFYTNSETNFPSTTLIFKVLFSWKIIVNPPSESGSSTFTSSNILIGSNFTIHIHLFWN